MILLDAYALVAFLADEPAAEEVEELLRGGGTAITVVNLAEAIDVTERVHHATAGEVREAVDPLVGDALRVIEVTAETAWAAADIRIRHYHRTARPLSLADCFLLAAAGADDSVATADGPVAEAARAEGIVVHALPNSGGTRP